MSFGLGGSQTSGTPESGAGGFLQSLLGSLHQGNMQREEMQMEKVQVGTAQRAAAQQQMDQLSKVMKANPSAQADPKMIAKMRGYAKVLGLPDPVDITPGKAATPQGGQVGSSDTTDTATAGTPAQLPKESVNMGIVAPPVTFQDLDEATKARYLAMPIADRKAAMENIPGVTAGFMNAPQIMTSGETVQFMKNMQSTITQFNSGIASGAQATAEIGSMVEQAHNAGYSTDSLIDMIHSNAASGPETVAKIAQMDSTVFANMSKAEHDKALTAYEKLI